MELTLVIEIRMLCTTRTCLRTLAFLIFISDLNFAIWSSSTFDFAVDTCFSTIKCTIKEINIYVNKDLRSLSKWLNANKSSLNNTKTEVLVFKRKCRVLDTDLKLKLFGKKLFTGKFVNYFGITLDEYLQWNFHINQLCLKLNEANAVLCKIRHYVLCYLPITPFICLHCLESTYQI